MHIFNQGKVVTIISDGLNNYLLIYDAATGDTESIIVDEAAGRSSAVYWSPNGRKIAYIAESGIISIVDAITGAIAKIDQIEFPAFVDWSSDSTRVIYSTGVSIRIYNVLNYTAFQITRTGASYPQWFPNDRVILYEAKDIMGISQIYSLNIDGTNQKQLTSNKEWPLNHVLLSPNGRYVLYTSPGASISEIYTLELATGLVNKIPGGPEAKNYYPVWSPDSTRIAYSSTHFMNGKYYSLIRTSGVKGEGDTTLAIASCYATPVSWSPDSNKIAYLSGCREDKPPVELWIIDTRKPVSQNIISGFLFYNLDWSPTSQRLL